VQHTDALVLDDANAQSRMAQLTSGSSVDLMNQLSYSSMAGGGAYSPYVGAIVDTAKILSSLHTAHFQYIPALALPAKDTLNLRLSVPPSFKDPKSGGGGGVARRWALPGRRPLHPVNPAESYCAQKPGLVLPAEGAPLGFCHTTRLRPHPAYCGQTQQEKITAAGKSAVEGRSVAGWVGAGAPAPPCWMAI